MKPMLRAYVGAAMVVAGIVGLVEAYSHRPIRAELIVTLPGKPAQHYPLRPEGLSSSAYEVLRIGGWALVVVGAIAMVVVTIRMRQKRLRPS
jgi:hypothetical protein